jgi:colanic acid biosynthesis glycosyl transferase WcaI
MRDPRPHLIAVNRFYWPDHSATSQLLTDLCEHLAANGFRVTVITSRMRYDAPDERLEAFEERNGVAIRRVRTTRLGRDRIAGRAVDYASFYASALAAMLRVAGPGDVILAKTDPPMISVPAMLAARLRGAHLVNWLQDVFPRLQGRWEWAGPMVLRGPGCDGCATPP